jgi:hypothetical protein
MSNKRECDGFAEYIYECEALIGPVAWVSAALSDLRLVCKMYFES